MKSTSTYRCFVLRRDTTFSYSSCLFVFGFGQKEVAGGQNLTAGISSGRSNDEAAGAVIAFDKAINLRTLPCTTHHTPPSGTTRPTLGHVLPALRREEPLAWSAFHIASLVLHVATPSLRPHATHAEASGAQPNHHMLQSHVLSHTSHTQRGRSKDAVPQEQLVVHASLGGVWALCVWGDFHHP